MKNSTKNVIIIVLSTLLVSVIAGLYFFTKSFERPKLNRMVLTFPESGVASIKKDPKNSISVLMAKNNRVFWYRNETNPIKLNESSYSKLENVILDQANKIDDKNLFFVTIVPSKEASFKNTVDLLDIMKKTKIHNYAISDMSEPEIQALEKSI